MRVHRSFGFVDVSGFTALTEHEGDEQAVEVLTAFRALLHDICSRRGVRIAKWLGDGVMLVCVDTTPLLATIMELHHVVDALSEADKRVSIRSGITSGDVILMEGDDYIGHCVNVAARLCDLAQGGEALADPSVVDHLPRWGKVLAHRDVTLRGVDKPVHTSSIGMVDVESDSASQAPSASATEVRSRDPICGLPLCDMTAELTATDRKGALVLFCSTGCLDTWQQRPARQRSSGGARSTSATPRG